MKKEMLTKYVRIGPPRIRGIMSLLVIKSASDIKLPAIIMFPAIILRCVNRGLNMYIHLRKLKI